MKKALLLTLAVLASAASAQTTIKINGYGGTDQALVNDLINRFVKPALAKDKITVVYEPLQGDYNKGLTTLLAAGTAGDVFYLPAETLDGFVATKKVMPLNGLINTSPFIKSLNTAFTRKGRLYGIAKDFNTLTLIYNKDLFDEAGVKIPRQHRHLDNLANQANHLTPKIRQRLSWYLPSA